MEVIRKNKRQQVDLLMIPKEYFDQIFGNKRRRISAVITDPRSRHVILTRYPDDLKVWHKMTIERGLDFIPTFILQMAKIDKNNEFTIDAKDGNVIVRRKPK